MARFAKVTRVYFWEEPLPQWEAASVGGRVPTLQVKRHGRLTVLRPVLPKGQEGGQALRAQAKLLRTFMAEEGLARPVLWFYSPLLLEVAAGVAASLVVYDCMDELSAFRFAPTNLRRMERRLLEMADIVFTGGRSLYEEKRALHANVHLYPSAVDLAHFAPARGHLEEPADQVDIPHPRLGFYGVVDERLDQDLLLQVATARPDWHIVILGPVVKIDADLLPRRPNIHYLGMKSYAQLPTYLSGWDVALILFACNEATRRISPTKTPEYLAAGRPVVSTPIPDIVRGYGEFEAVAIAANTDEFVAACEHALTLAEQEGGWWTQVDGRLAAESWDRVWSRMLDDMRVAKHLGDRAEAGSVMMQSAVALPAFKSFFMGGFESSSQKLPSGRRLDIIAKTRHDQHAAEDYRLAAGAGLFTIRDALRWHAIEAKPGHYDWDSFLPMLRAAHDAGVQVIWDLCHYGMPDHIDFWSESFVRQFAAYAAAAADLVAKESGAPGIFCPINEMSYWAWAAGQGRMEPIRRGKGDEVKRQLVRASLAAVNAIRATQPDARFVQAEPLISVRRRSDHGLAPHHLAQYEAVEMMMGLHHPELGGTPAHLDIIGANFYFNNQWVQEGGEKIAFGDHRFRMLSDLLGEIYKRYRRPILLSETGVEGAGGPAWLHYVARELRISRQRGIPVLGLCLYPLMDYPGWHNDRHCRCGLVELDADYNKRSINLELLQQLQSEQHLDSQLDLAIGSEDRVAKTSFAAE